MAVRSFILLLALSVTLVIAADKEAKSGNVGAKVRGKSGKVEIVRKGSDGKFDYSKAFTLEVDFVKQRDKDNKDVGKPVNSLASQDFTFSNLNQNAEYQNISAVNLNLHAFLDAPKATLKLEMYIFKEDGNVTFGDENFQVANGTLKFLLMLENYTFCEGDAIASICKKDDIGKFVDVAIVVKSKGSKKAAKRAKGKKGKIGCMKEKCPDVYDFDDEAEMALTRSNIIDGKSEMAPDGYPMADTQGSKQRFIFRARKFNSTIIWDPTIVVGDSPEEPSVPTKAPTDLASSIHLSLATLIVMLIAMFM